MTAPALPGLPSTLDPALPGLRAALSAHPPGAAADEECRVRHVEWVPRLRCRVVHEVRAAGRAPTLRACEVRPSGTAVLEPAEDRDLPGLPVVLDPSGVQDRLTDILPNPISPRQVTVTPVAYRPGARAVVAYDVVADSSRSRLYAKVLADGADRYAAAATGLVASARRLHARPPVPEVVAVWRDLGAVVQRSAPGRGLSEVLRDRATSGRESSAYSERLGRLLAVVHATASTAEPPWTAEDELAALEPLLTAAWHADPVVGRSLVALADRLADSVPGETDLVLSHGAFRAGQVVVGDGALCLLDLDTVCVSDPARDAGNALAYLSWDEIRGALSPERAEALQRSFLAGYAGSRPALPGPALAWWSAAAMAKIAGRRFRSLATSEWRHVPALLDRAAAQIVPIAPGPRGGRSGEPGSRAPFDLLDCDRMTEALRQEPSLRAAEDLRVIDTRPVAEAPGRRRVVRYAVAGIERGGPVPLIGKSYAERHRAAITYQNLRLLGDGAFAATPNLAVPAPVWSLPGLRMVLYREVIGTPLDGLPAGAGATVAVLAARWLATLHASHVVLARRLDLAHEVADVEEWAARVGRGAPQARTAAYALADRLATAAAELPAVTEVPIHRDFHAGHVMAVADAPGTRDRGGVPGRIVVLDLDEARMGDPALDVAHFTTCLDASRWPGAPAARAAFLDAYGPLAGPAAGARTAFFAAYTSMKIAKQLVTGRGPVLPADGRARTAAVATVLDRGLACLDA